MSYPPSKFERECEATSRFVYDYSYPPGDVRRYGGRPAALWRRVLRRITDWVNGETA